MLSKEKLASERHELVLSSEICSRNIKLLLTAVQTLSNHDV